MSLNEPISQIALQFAVISSKIICYNFPTEWPEVFPQLLSGIQSPNELDQSGALLVLHHVIKALSLKNASNDWQVLYQLFTSILQQWNTFSKLFLQSLDGDSLKTRSLLENSLLSLKILKRFVEFGFKDFLKDLNAVNFLSSIYQQIGPFLDCRVYLKSQLNLLDTCEKYIVLLVKILKDVLRYQPFAFIQFIQPTLECCITFCFNKSFEEKLFEKLIVQFLHVVKAILWCNEYKPENLDDTKKSLTLEAHKIKVEFFTLPVLREMFNQLLSRYFLLTEEDISGWENSPEEFVSDEGGKSWKISLRPCAEQFFKALFHEFPDLLTPLVVEELKNIQNTPSHDLLGILKKDAVYNAVGLAADDLEKEIDFDGWFTNVLFAELQNKSPGYHIIRRRVIWLTGEWVGVKMSSKIRPLLYEIILQLLNNEENLIVRLTAAKALKKAVRNYDFSRKQYGPYLENCILALFKLLKEVKECILKMYTLRVLSFVIKRVGSEVCPHAEVLIQYLLQLWDNCGEHNMLQSAILNCFVALVKGLGTLSESLQPFLIPKIALSTDVTQPPHVYLMEAGLDLWWAVLDNTSTCSEDLMKLASNIFPLLGMAKPTVERKDPKNTDWSCFVEALQASLGESPDYKVEALEICMQITEAYIILAPENFLKIYDKILIQTFQSAVTDLKYEGSNILKVQEPVLKVVETVFILFPEYGPVYFEPLLSFVLSLALEKNELPIFSTAVYLSILSRVILHNKVVFRRLLLEKTNQFQTDADVVLGELLDLWLKQMPRVLPVQQKKLLGLALTCLLTCNSDVVHKNICAIFLAIVNVLNDITGFDTKSRLRVFDLPQTIETEQRKRKKELKLLDPVHKAELKDYFYNQVMALQQSVGPTKFQDLMSTVDAETMEKLQEYLKIS